MVLVAPLQGSMCGGHGGGISCRRQRRAALELDVQRLPMVAVAPLMHTSPGWDNKYSKDQQSRPRPHHVRCGTSTKVVARRSRSGAGGQDT